MADRHYFNHINPEGESPRDRMVAAGYTPGYWDSTVFQGGETAGAVVRAWVASPRDNAILLSANFQHIGIGRAFDDDAVVWKWTVNFASPGS